MHSKNLASALGHGHALMDGMVMDGWVVASRGIIFGQQAPAALPQCGRALDPPHGGLWDARAAEAVIAEFPLARLDCGEGQSVASAHG